MQIKTNSHTQAGRGFTALEILIVMVVVFILAALAYPSYRHAIVKSRRAEGRSALLKLMQQQERFFSQYTTYTAFSSGSSEANGKRFAWHSGETPESSAYEISGIACPGDDIRNCVMLIAKPGTNKVNRMAIDPECGDLSLTSAGQKSANRSDCW